MYEDKKRPAVVISVNAEAGRVEVVYGGKNPHPGGAHLPVTLVGGEGQKMGLLMDTYFRHRNVCWVKLDACKVLLGECPYDLMVEFEQIAFDFWRSHGGQAHQTRPNASRLTSASWTAKPDDRSVKRSGRSLSDARTDGGTRPAPHPLTSNGAPGTMRPVSKVKLPGWVVVFTVEGAGPARGPDVFHPERIVQETIQEHSRERSDGVDLRVFTFQYPAEDGQRYQHTVKLQDPKTLDDLIEQARIDLAKGEYYDVPGRS
ncbi:MAG: hypothetical protein IPM35_34640 [Myxococcales bacterium]|nr:hypothetical protein [Myxococcales bacterium]